MSGVTEWKNAVFLWVNVDEGEGYANLFERSPPAAAGETRIAGCLATEGPPTRALLVENNATQRPGNPAEKGGDIAAEPAGDLKPGKLEENGRGVTEKLAGDCVEDGSTVDAALSEELSMTWYAGGRMAPESALIRRLLKCSETEGDCDAADRAVVSPARSSDVKLEGGVAGRPQQGGVVFRSQQNEEGTTRSMAKAKVDFTTETAVVAAEAGPNGATSTLRARAKPESVPHKQAKNYIERSSKLAAAAVESVAGESAVHLATAGAADQPERGSGSSSGNNGSSSSSKCEDSVLLFCRRPKEPYVFCGRLGYAQHWSAERPVRFVWRLLDAGELSLQPDFGSIVEAAGIGSGGEKVEK